VPVEPSSPGGRRFFIFGTMITHGRTSDPDGTL